mgnify:CR=1 FL=1
MVASKADLELLGKNTNQSGRWNKGNYGKELSKKADAIRAGGGISGNVSPKRQTAAQGETYYFPSQDDLAAERPQVRFSCVKLTYPSKEVTQLTRESCYFPCPANIAFGDAANLSSIDLGIAGAAADMIYNTGASGSDKAMGAFEATKKAIGKTFLGGLDAALGGSLTKAQAIKKQSMNQFTNTTFQGNNVRSFTFNFKMVASSEADATMIKKIDHFFRANMYGGNEAQGDSKFNAFLSYPPIWEIDFLESVGFEGAKFNPYLPKIFACYLGGFNATFNTTAAAWHPGGAPLEVDVSLTFTESRALNAIDINALEGLAGNGNYYDNEIENQAARGIGLKGRATAAPDNSLQGFIQQADEGDNKKGVTAEEIQVLGHTDAATLRNARDGVNPGISPRSGYGTASSDIRLKENIYEVDVSPSGIKIYEFKYIDGVDRYRGVMAQDLLEIDSKHPAVSTDNNGFYVVNYGLLDVDMEKIS